MKASISQIKTFKACRRAWHLRYREGLIPAHPSDALEAGKSYHSFIEDLENGIEPICDYSKAHAMCMAYAKYIYPNIHVVQAEQEMEKQIGQHILHGIVDGISSDGCVVEHKTTSRDISAFGDYEYGLLWDEQILAYMSLTGCRCVHYTVCKKPTIRQKKDETIEEYYQRMVDWYDEDTESKIRTFDITRTDEEVAEFERDFEQICDEMQNCKYAYKNTCNCMMYGTRCPYASVCINYNPEQEYVDFIRNE